jgi:lysophospholipase L1-like esterase
MNSLQRGLLFRFAILIVCGLALAQSACAESPTSKVKSASAPRFENEIAAFEAYDHKNAPPRDPILFVGSSTIRLWQTADAFPNLPVINRGFGGSTIDDVNHFADRIVFKYKPRQIIFYAGDNDLAAGRSPDRVFGDFQTFLGKVHEHLPDTSIVYLAIKPSIARWKLWPQMQEVNGRVKELTQENKQLAYIDTAPPLLGPDGKPHGALFRDDGLHMNDKGYAAWNNLLGSQLQRLQKNGN